MMASLIAFCGVVAILAGAIVVLGMAAQCLKRANRRSSASAGSPGSGIRFRSSVPLADRWREGRERRSVANERGAGGEPEAIGGLSEGSTPIRALPFARRPIPRPQPPLGKPPPAAAWRR